MDPFTLATVSALGIIGALGLFGRKKRRRGSRSAPGIAVTGPEDSKTEGMMNVLESGNNNVDIDDDLWAKVGHWLGVGYKWGGEGPDGVDCSGFLSEALEDLGLSDGKRYTVATLGAACDPVAVGDQRPGDIAIYNGRHAMLVASYPRPELGGHSHVMGASGGSSLIQGYDPSLRGYSANARVKIFETAEYRKKDGTTFRTYGRLRSAA